MTTWRRVAGDCPEPPHRYPDAIRVRSWIVANFFDKRGSAFPIVIAAVLLPSVSLIHPVTGRLADVG